MQDSGFSFIELLVSVTIMAVMMAAAVVSYSNTNQRSRDARRQADVQTIRSALEICRSNTGIYPASIAGTVTCSDATVTLSATPTDPQTGNAYPYSRPTTTTYSLSCTLELAGSCSYTQP
ncbi:hypothetical protein A2703_02325 [Candidatus Collierbacteria bacterium RIFCSPHIGHO2_01_FULL_50_25]|uniref:Type II secretion system protein GspG C-terminal domain-containing protein n=1 Tax=Candidatus Collierbacteria bacterium RIFCSPHIGHO2_01_FULL_50_25 TaxID=1817722 RepID=A0A1F5EUV1_9BACT|nr:MAG: hypothetical protein A2703_02325 [Candidatus Collierbacteria bacterium RIFCSPHIGHO2_01_FULL_50_25]